MHSWKFNFSLAPLLSLLSIVVLLVSGCESEEAPNVKSTSHRKKATYLTYTTGSSGGLLVKIGPTATEIAGCKILANGGDHHAAQELAYYYTWYLKDYKEGDYWTIKGAELGNVTCQWNAYTLLMGKGDVKYHDEAMHWLKKAAAQGHNRSIEILEELGRVKP